MSESTVISTRPMPGQPRPYAFPAFERHVLANGLTIVRCDLPGRPLVSATLVIRNGAADEPAEVAGATVLAARALSEGTARFDAIALVEATERLGASLHAEAGWDASTAGVEVPASRLELALELLAEMVAQPTFPAVEVERLRDERLNDLLQARADPRRRVDEAFADAIYAFDAPYHRPAGGLPETVEPLERGVLAATFRRGLDPARLTLIVGGDLNGVELSPIVERLFGGWVRPAEAATAGPIVDRRAAGSARVRLVDRPGSVQTEIRVGHVGVPRAVPDYHAIAVMGAILGGLFNSRLNLKLREEKGYTYGAGAGFDFRRAAGPFSARAAVNTEVTVAALGDLLAELERIREAPVTDAELSAARDFLVGVFPLRFETPGPVVGALGGLIVHGLPDDELVHFRERIEAVSGADILSSARRRIDVEGARIVLVGDADRVAGDLEAAGFGPLEVVHDDALASGPAGDAPG